MKQKKFAVWIVAIFLVTACTRFMATNTGSPNQIVQNKNCPSSITILGDTQVAPSESISLAALPTSLDWQYQWSTSDMTLLSAPQKSVTMFTAPTSDGLVELAVVVTPQQNCDAIKASIEISVVSPPTFTPTATEMVPFTKTPTFTPTYTPTSIPPATNTLVPTVTLTNTPYPTPLPSQTPTPTVPSFAILLKEPKDETCVGSDNAVFEWLTTRPLNSIEGKNGEYFALNIWAEGSPIYSVSWIKDSRYEIENISDPIAVYTELINCSGENGCFWNVDLIVSKVDRGSGWKPESFTTLYSSPARWFCTEVASPPIPPTNTPEPLVQATPTVASCPPDC